MKMARTIQAAVIGTIAAVCLTPIASTVLPLPRAKLHGVEMSYHLPRWSLPAFQKGSLQAKTDQWATRSHPLWAWSVRAVNQLTYSLFGEVSLDYRTSVQGGNDGYLWQPMYARAFNRLKPPPRGVIKEAFSGLKQLQDHLASRNIPVIAVINPNLIGLYPELLPEKYKAVKPRESSYEVAQKEIARSKARVIDANQLLKAKQPQFPFRFFEPTGSHWNDVGSCLAAREVARELAEAWGEEIPAPRCEQNNLEYPPHGTELDLVEIANLLWPESLYRPAPYLTEHPRPTHRKPRKVLLIGTSFLFGLEKQLLKHGIADSTTLLFYFRQSRRNGDGGFGRFDKKKLSAEEILSYDAIIVDANSAGPGVLGFGFLPFARAAFKLEDPEQKSGQRRQHP